jgi:anti-sigma factor RsiW
MTDAHPSSTAAHAAHDLTIVAALATRDGDLDRSTADAAREQLASCTACADVLADLAALQTALPITSTPARPRDYRLTEADALRLHRTGWRRFLGFFGSARDGVSRPLAIGLTTLGLAGLMIATLPSMFMASGPSSMLAPVGAPVEQAQPAADGAGDAYGSDRITMSGEPAPSDALAGEAAASDAVAGEAPASEAAASEPADGGVFSGANPNEIGGRLEATGDSATALRDDASGLSVLLVVAGMLLIAGICLFGLRWSARRLR